MLLLTSTTDIVRVTTGAAAAVDAHASVMDNVSGSVTPVRINTANIATATTTTVVGSPAASTQRNVKLLALFNTHASVSTSVLIEHVDSASVAESLWSGTLLAGESVIMDELGVFTKYSPAGLVETLGLPLTTKGDILVYDTAANRLPIGADMQVLTAAASSASGMKWAVPYASNRSTATVAAAYAADTYLAGSSIAMPAGGPVVGTKYRCVFDMVKTAAGVATLIVTLRYGTAGTTADAAIVTFTFAAGTAVADTGEFEVLAHFRTVGSGTSAVLVAKIECTHTLASTGVISNGTLGWVPITTVSGGFNSTPAGSILGISVNGGTSFSGTNTIVETEAYNLSI